jgi:hypothetical protein
MLISIFKGAIKMRIKISLKENKEVFSSNINLLSKNVKMVSDLMPSHVADKFKRNISTLNFRLKSINNSTAFAKLFFEYFVLVQNFHSALETFKCSDLVDQRYEGYQFFKPL